MDITATLLTINTTLLGILLGVAGYFLRDLHRKFSELVAEVRQLWIEHARQTAKADGRLDSQEEETRQVRGRVERIEGNLMKKQA